MYECRVKARMIRCACAELSESAPLRLLEDTFSLDEDHMNEERKLGRVEKRYNNNPKIYFSEMILFVILSLMGICLMRIPGNIQFRNSHQD